MADKIDKALPNQKTTVEIPGEAEIEEAIQENIKEVIVDAASVKGQSQPIIVHSKNKSKTDKTTAA